MIPLLFWPRLPCRKGKRRGAVPGSRQVLGLYGGTSRCRRKRGTPGSARCRLPGARLRE
jgi:hypothetical protein